MPARLLSPDVARRAAELVFTVGAVGEIAVGLLVAILPGSVMGFLLGMPLDEAGVAVARMMGVAAAALGFAWWPDRQRLDPRRLRETAPAFVGYNVGVGLVFLAWGWTAARPLGLPWLVAAVHLLTAGALALAVARSPAPRG